MSMAKTLEHFKMATFNAPPATQLPCGSYFTAFARFQKTLCLDPALSPALLCHVVEGRTCPPGWGRPVMRPLADVTPLSLIYI